ncbi:MAG: sugar phosphate isomerase/epimerase family protein [Candidatus Firestonebacteria bacterium]
MFKLGIFTDEVSQELDVAIKLAKEFNLDSVEIRTVWNKSPHQLDNNDIDKIKQLLDSANLKISCIASPFLKCDIDNEKEYLEHIEIFKKCIIVAKKLGTNLIRGFTFWRKGELEQYYSKIIDKYKEPARIAKDENIIIAIENEASCFIGRGADLGKFLKDINSKNVLAVWDPANEIYDPKGENPYPDGYEHIKKFMIHMHLKDAVHKGENSAECVEIGEGEIDFPSQFKELKTSGYNGYVSLETHWRAKGNLTESQMNRPGGGAFSESGEISSRICLENWMRILRSI